MSFFRNSGLEAFPGPHGWYIWRNQIMTSTHSLEEIVARLKESAPDDDEAAILSNAQYIHSLDPQAIADTLNDRTFKEYKPEQLLPQLVCPTLLVRGEIALGSVVNDDDVEFFQRSVPHGITVQVKDVGHLSYDGPTGQATATLEHITRFLNSL